VNKKKSILYSKKFLIFNIALASMIVGFVLSMVLVYTLSANGKPELTTAFAQDADDVEKGYQALENIQYSFRNVAKTALPVVVEISTVEVVKANGPQGGDAPFEFFFGPQGGNGQDFRRPGLGSGVMVKRDGNKVYVITNNHVAGNASEMTVLLNDGRKLPAKLVAKDERTDLALISFETKEQVPLAKLGDSDTLEVGDWAIAIGNPFGFESSLTVGVISALGRKAIPGSTIANFNDYIQTDAQINPGNSGGALLNLRGEVVGINTWIASSTGVSAGVGFAIPVNNVKKAMNDFITKGKVEYGWLGVGIDDPDQQTMPGVAEDLKIAGLKGALVVSVFKESPADKGGIFPGDYILSVDGKPVSDANQLTRAVGGLPPDKSVEFVILRYGKEQRLKVTLKTRDSEDKLRVNTNVWPGLTAVKLTDELRARLKTPASLKGVFLVSVVQGTQAQIAGLKLGDVLVKINDNEVASIMDFYRQINNKTKNELIFRVWRDNKEIILGVVR
jgi:Do/DeqQ family serine protease